MKQNQVHVDIFSTWPATMKEVHSVFEKNGMQPEVVSDKYDLPHVMIGCRDIEEILDDIIDISKEFPEETIRICYGGYGTSFNHEIVEICKNGELSIESDAIRENPN